MIFDTISITITISVIILLVSLLTSLFFFSFRKILNKDNDACSNYSLPEISILITAHDNVGGLRQNLKQVLSQEYENNFEVIVIMEQGNSEALSVIKEFKHDKRVYTSFVPHHSLFMSKDKLAVSIGVKAAHYEWIFLIDSDSIPQSTKWLSTMGRNCKEEISLVIGYSNYNCSAKQYYRFERLYTLLYLMHRAQIGTAYRTNGPNVGFKKSTFIAKDGFRGNLQFLHGKYDFIVNKFAQKGNTAIELSSESFLLESKPTKKEWVNRNLSYLSIRKNLLRSHSFRLKWWLNLSMMYLNYILILTSIMYSLLYSQALLLLVSISALLLTILIRTVIVTRTIKIFDKTLPIWKLLFFELSIGIHSLLCHIRYICSDKMDYTTHKL